MNRWLYFPTFLAPLTLTSFPSLNTNTNTNTNKQYNSDDFFPSPTSTLSLDQTPHKHKATMSSSQAFVQREAPAFTATTVFPGGEFKDISLSDYRGQW